MEWLYFRYSVSVCVYVCLSVCPFVNKMPIQTYTPILMWSSLNSCRITSNPIDIGDLGSKVNKVTVTKYPFFFLHHSLLTSLMYISSLLCLIKLKFGMPLTYALCKFVCEFHWNQVGDDVKVTSIKFSIWVCLQSCYFLHLKNSNIDIFNKTSFLVQTFNNIKYI